MMLTELPDGDPDFGYVIRLGVLHVMALSVFGLPFGASGLSGFAAAQAAGVMSRALPLLMITVVVYSAGELWQLAAAFFLALGIVAVPDDVAVL